MKRNLVKASVERCLENGVRDSDKMDFSILASEYGIGSRTKVNSDSVCVAALSSSPGHDAE